MNSVARFFGEFFRTGVLFLKDISLLQPAGRNIPYSIFYEQGVDRRTQKLGLSSPRIVSSRNSYIKNEASKGLDSSSKINI